MSIRKSKRMWIKPELVILARNKPEEAVLESCQGPGSMANPMTTHEGCIDNVYSDCGMQCSWASSS